MNRFHLRQTGCGMTAAQGRQRGLSLVELMVAMTLGLIMLATLVALFDRQYAARSELEKSSRQIESGRYAVQTIADDVRHAGYYMYASTNLPAVPGAVPDPCSTTLANVRAALPIAIQGFNMDGGGVRPSCIRAANHLAGTDILVIRRVQSAPATKLLPAALLAGETYLQANPSEYVLDRGDTPANFNKKITDWTGDPNAPAPIRKFIVHIYYVSPCSVPSSGDACDAAADGGRPIPTLKRLELTTAGGVATISDTQAVSVVPIAEGIENLQIEYGVDTDAAGSTGSGAPDGAYTAAPADVTAWSNVVSARIFVLARNAEPTGGFVDTDTGGAGGTVRGYDLGLAGTVTPGGPFKRKVYAAVARATNVAERREIP